MITKTCYEGDLHVSKPLFCCYCTPACSRNAKIYSGISDTLLCCCWTASCLRHWWFCFRVSGGLLCWFCMDPQLLQLLLPLLRGHLFLLLYTWLFLIHVFMSLQPNLLVTLSSPSQTHLPLLSWLLCLTLSFTFFYTLKPYSSPFLLSLIFN